MSNREQKFARRAPQRCLRNELKGLLRLAEYSIWRPNRPHFVNGHIRELNAEKSYHVLNATDTRPLTHDPGDPAKDRDEVRSLDVG